ncbi:MAG: RICIN domain-containing protein [Deltaproteobacteria bacterium]|nr:RICIN domain-containing protein [Deltaproteobacteria bacterium]
MLPLCLAAGCATPEPELNDDTGNAAISTGAANGTKVLMQYEAWFGPKATRWRRDVAISPILSSQSMAPYGGGYDSTDDAVIEQHYRWLLDMGVDGIVLDHTNNVACTFTPGTFNQELPQVIVDRYIRAGRTLPNEYGHYFGMIGWLDSINALPKDSSGDQQLLQLLRTNLGCRNGDVFQVAMAAIKSNNSYLFSAFDRLAKKYNRVIKIVVLMGGFEPTAWEPLPSQNGKVAMDLQLEFYDALYRRYPDLELQYEGRPLILSYFAAPTATQLYGRLDARLGLATWNRFTVRKMGGFMSNQLGLPGYRGDGRLGLTRYTEVWTWIDRLRASPPIDLRGPSYAESMTGQVEAFTVTMANPAVDGWGDVANKIPTTQGDLRRNGETFRSFMRLARDLNPRFLLINQFNEFAFPDQGWDEETTNDIEPTNLWGMKYVNLVKSEIDAYRALNGPGPQSGSGGDIRNINGKCVDVHAGCMNSNGCNVQVWDCNNTAQQTWTVSGGQIRNANGKCIDVHAGCMNSNGCNVQVWDCNNTAQQTWTVSGGQIRNANGKCIDVHAGCMNSNGCNVQVWDCNGTAQQTWSPAVSTLGANPDLAIWPFASDH